MPAVLKNAIAGYTLRQTTRSKRAEELGEKLGNDKMSAADGILEENFIGTQLIGPFLVKNPHFLAYVVRKLTGEKPVMDPESNQVKAYEVAVSQLTGRLQK